MNSEQIIVCIHCFARFLPGKDLDVFLCPSCKMPPCKNKYKIWNEDRKKTCVLEQGILYRTYDYVCVSCHTINALQMNSLSWHEGNEYKKDDPAYIYFYCKECGNKNRLPTDINMKRYIIIKEYNHPDGWGPWRYNEDWDETLEEI